MNTRFLLRFLKISIVNGFSILVLLLFYSNCFCTRDGNEAQTIQLVVTLYRHGDRLTDIEEMYPNDPNRNASYYPYGNGELTNLGKRRMYKLGQLFRKMYNSLLGRLYLPGLVDPVSTDLSRTICSLQVFLAGLFPPCDTILEWNQNFNWNPIPFNVLVRKNNRVLSFAMLFCPKYRLLYETYRQTPEAKAIEDRYQPLFPYISKHSGLNVSAPFDVVPMKFGLTTEKEWGLKLPKWTKRIYPEYLTSLVETNHIFSTATPELNQLFGGFLVKKTINDMERIIQGISSQPKMYIYSAHETTLVGLMGALNIYYPHIPRYGAALILELHKVRQQHYVKIRYNMDVDEKFVDLKIPGCNTLCPFESFVKLLQENLPGDGDPCIIEDK